MARFHDNTAVNYDGAVDSAGKFNYLYKAGMQSTEDDFNTILFLDSGEGADQDVINNMFNSFYTTKEGGTGAGLAYCKRTIDSFNGKIDCESIVGEYCEFKISLPEVKIFS